MCDYDENDMREYYEFVEERNREAWEEVNNIDWERRNELIRELELIEWE